MESSRKRRRRGKGHSYANLKMPIHTSFSQQFSRKSSFTNNLTSFLIMASLIGIIYLMLDYHCTICGGKYNTSHLTKSIEEIAKNLSSIQNNYNDLEMKISHFSQELPKVERQIEILEALANTIQKNGYRGVWNPKADLPVPNVEVIA